VRTALARAAASRTVVCWPTATRTPLSLVLTNTRQCSRPTGTVCRPSLSRLENTGGRAGCGAGAPLWVRRKRTTTRASKSTSPTRSRASGDDGTASRRLIR
jgi:hypothetical protein